MNPATTLALQISAQMAINSGYSSSSNVSRKRRSSGSSNDGPSDRAERQKREWLHLPKDNAFPAFAAKEELSGLPAIPKDADGQPMSLQEMMDRAQGLGELKDLSADHRGAAYDSLSALAAWGAEQRETPGMAERIRDSAGNNKFLSDLREKRDRAKRDGDYSQRSAHRDMEDAYADPEAARQRFDDLVSEYGERNAYIAVVRRPNLLGPTAGIGFMGVGNETHQDAHRARGYMVSKMEDLIEQRDREGELTGVIEAEEKKRPVEQHLADFDAAVASLEQVTAKPEFKRIGADIQSQRIFEEALKADPAAAFLQAYTRAEGVDPGGRWEHLAMKAGDAVAAHAAGPDTPVLTADAPEPRPAPARGLTA